jgi:hypothetical protein
MCRSRWATIDSSALRSGGYGAVDVNINVNGKPAQTIRAPLNAGAPPAPAGGMPIAVPFWASRCDVPRDLQRRVLKPLTEGFRHDHAPTLG